MGSNNFIYTCMYMHLWYYVTEYIYIYTRSKNRTFVKAKRVELCAFTSDFIGLFGFVSSVHLY